LETTIEDTKDWTITELSLKAPQQIRN